MALNNIDRLIATKKEILALGVDGKKIRVVLKETLLDAHKKSETYCVMLDNQKAAEALWKVAMGRMREVLAPLLDKPTDWEEE